MHRGTIASLLVVTAGAVGVTLNDSPAFGTPAEDAESQLQGVAGAAGLDLASYPPAPSNAVAAEVDNASVALASDAPIGVVRAWGLDKVPEWPPTGREDAEQPKDGTGAGCALFARVDIPLCVGWPCFVRHQAAADKWANRRHIVVARVSVLGSQEQAASTVIRAGNRLGRSCARFFLLATLGRIVPCCRPEGQLHCYRRAAPNPALMGAC